MDMDMDEPAALYIFAFLYSCCLLLQEMNNFAL